jgi:hypothetical protein
LTWAEIAARWKEVNDWAEVTRYHAAYVNARAGKFADWPKEKQIEYSKRLLQIILDQSELVHVVAAGMEATEYYHIFNESGRRKLGSPYMRADARRIVIVAPGSLVDQWREEMFEKFGLEFRVFTRDLEAATPSGNPFEDLDHLIVRLDQMARNEDLQDKLCTAGWDLVVFDEAHKLAAHFFGNKLEKTGRFRLAEKLGAQTRHLLLMTATPHNGKEEDFQLFLSLLDSDRFYGKFRDGAHKVDCSDLIRRMVKEKLVKFDGTPLFPERRAYTVNYELSDLEAALYESVTEYVKTEMGKADELDGKRRPLAAVRAVLFGQMVNDPSWKWEMEHPGEIPPNNLKASWAASRKRLFGILEELVTWDNTTNEDVIEKARAEIRKSWRESCELNEDHPQAGELFDPNKIPALHDPFAGGGAIPLEAQRLGLDAYASDLNPVAVLINKARIEILSKFAGRPPVNPEKRKENALIEREWRGAQGLAEDVRYYGRWMRDEAAKRIGHLYPTIEVTEEMAKDRLDLKALIGHELTVVAWLWARTVKSPNPAFRHVHVPLLSTFTLSGKEGIRTGAPVLSCHHLLCVQTIRNRERFGHGQQGLGNFP